MSYDSNQSNVQFEDVNPHALTMGLLFGETEARVACAKKCGGNKQQYLAQLQKYQNQGVVGKSQAVTSFMREHKKFCRDPKMILQNGNIFGEFISLAPLADTPDYHQKLKNRMTIGHDLTDEEMQGADAFIASLSSLHESKDMREKAEETRAYKRSIERLWNQYERPIIAHVKEILGDVELESTGKVSVFIMYPNYDMQRSCQLSSNRTFLFLGKSGEDLEAKTLASIADGAVRPMIPIKSSMTEIDRKKLDAFLRLLTDKEIYTAISEKSGLAMETPKENHVLMGKMYPYWLGYKHRNDFQRGLNPEAEIAREIERDKAYYDSVKPGTREKNNLTCYALESLDPRKIAEFFRYKKTMTPYDFIQLDFDNRDAVSYGSSEVRKKMPQEKEERIK